jgi:pilus assembly protein CpaB
MKWSIIGLLSLGILAALCASILVGALRANQANNNTDREQINPQMAVLVAKQDIPAAKIVESEDVLKRTVSSDQLPENYLADPAQVVGKVLRAPMVEGQVFRKSCFAEEGSGLHLATAIPEGMRAVSMNLSNSSSLYGILYPGSTVDVIVSYKGFKQSSSSQTLLENIRVIAVENQTIVTQEDSSTYEKSVVARKTQTVSLLVNPKQAERLQAAMEEGNVSLALRNPLDSKTVQIASRQNEVTNKKAEPDKPEFWEMTIMRNRKHETRKFQLITADTGY